MCLWRFLKRRPSQASVRCLKRTMYGTRDAGATWQDDNFEHLEARSLRSRWFQSIHLQSHGRRRDRRATTRPQGSSMVTTSQCSAMTRAWMRSRLCWASATTSRPIGRLGPDSQDDKESCFLNRILRYTGTAEEPAMELEAESTHVQLWRRLVCRDAKVGPTPATKMTAEAAEQLTCSRHVSG